MNQEILSRLEISEIALSEDKQFQLTHLGEHNIEIGKVLNAIRELDLSVPRTCHLGDWSKIANGSSGALDFNQMICSGGYGEASIYGFTQTESTSSEGAQGDWVYRPGGIDVNGKYRELPLRTWNGTEFVLRDRTRSYFCPFVVTEQNGALMPLSQFHFARGMGLEKRDFEATLLLKHWPEIESMVAALLESARTRSNSRQALHDLVGHAVNLDGSTKRAEIEIHENGFLMNGFKYESSREFALACRIPFLALAQPENFFSAMDTLPSKVPVLSNLLVSVLFAHFQAQSKLEIPLAEKFRLHLHWGARDMAGFPPYRRGYFKQKSTQKSLRIICNSLVEKFDNFRPLCFVLIPAAVFMLNPSKDSEQDQEIVESMFEAVIENRVAQENPDIQLVRIQNLISARHLEPLSRLSAYFKSRFVRSNVNVENPHGLSAPSERFLQLTFREACILVGILTSKLDPNSADPA